MVIRRKTMSVSVAMAALVSMSPVAANAASAVTKLSAKISGVAAGTQVLAVYSSGASARASVSGGKFTVTLPKASSSKVNVSLHLIGPNGQYAGPVSLGKKAAGKTKWYGSVAAKAGKTTKLGSIIYSTAQQYASMKASSATTSLALATALKGVSKAGQPAGAGRLGMAASKAVSSASLAPGDSIDWEWGVQAFAPGEVQAGGDLDADGMPNTLDIDDDGDGYADQVDQSAGKSGAQPTALYDAFSALETGISDRQAPINYNFLAQKYADPAELRKQLSILDDANFTLNTRVVAPFLTTNGSLSIQDAWVDCTGLAWCLAADQGSGDSLVSAPRMLPWGDGYIRDYWTYAFRKTGQTTCSIYVPTTSAEGCNEVLWSDFSQHKMLTAAKANGGSKPVSAPSWADHTGGFGLYDPYYDNPAGGSSGGGNSGGFDLTANVRPKGYSKFLDNFKAGDVLTVKATLSDGSPAEISMTISPFFVTAPAAFSFTPGGGAEQTVDYVTPENCGNNGQVCRLGTESNRLSLTTANPTAVVKFWRPQRLRTAGIDDAIAGTQAFVDMGALNYRIDVSSGDGGQPMHCMNTAVTMKDTDNSTFSEVKADPQYSNSFDYYKDGSSDTAPSVGRYVTATIDFSKCRDFVVKSGSTFSATIVAAGEELFGGSRTQTKQTFYAKFSS